MKSRIRFHRLDVRGLVVYFDFFFDFCFIGYPFVFDIF